MKKLIAILLLAAVGHFLWGFYIEQGKEVVAAKEWVELNEQVALIVGDVRKIKVYKIATTVTSHQEREKRVYMLVDGTISSAMITVGMSSDKGNPHIMSLDVVDSGGGSLVTGTAYLLIGASFILSFYFGDRFFILRALLFLSQKTSLTGSSNMALVYGAIALAGGIGVILT